jgi:nitrite reductase/ring-hydroxylating ferredoxin subunit
VAGREERVVLVLSADPLVWSRLERTAPGAGLALTPASAPPVGAPDVIVLDLDQPGSLDELERWRARFAESFIAGHVGLPRQELWLRAQQQGCDLVANRGSFARELVERLPAPGTARRHRFPLVEASELAGRIGLVLRAAETPVGPLAVFHFSGELRAVADVCPHAGATLSEGELEGVVLTCPRHGSQFDVRTGDRLRGPADEAIATFEVVEEDGFVHLLYG